MHRGGCASLIRRWFSPRRMVRNRGDCQRRAVGVCPYHHRASTVGARPTSFPQQLSPPPPPSHQKPLSGKWSCQCTRQRAQVSAGVRNPRMDSECASGCTWSTARATAPSPGRPTPGVVKQDKSSGGSVDTTETRSDPQRVRMCKGKRPIGAAEGNQTKTMASC